MSLHYPVNHSPLRDLSLSLTTTAFALIPNLPMFYFLFSPNYNLLQPIIPQTAPGYKPGLCLLWSHRVIEETDSSAQLGHADHRAHLS